MFLDLLSEKGFDTRCLTEVSCSGAAGFWQLQLSETVTLGMCGNLKMPNMTTYIHDVHSFVKALISP